MIQADTLLPTAEGAELKTGLSFADYLAIDAVNVSTLLHFLDNTDKMAQWEIRKPKKETDSQLFGHAVHAAILEPTTFDDLYTQMPSFGDLRTKAGREARDEWAERNIGKAQVPGEMYARVLETRDLVLKSPDPELRELFAGPGQNELTILFRDEQTDLPCKARVDRITTLHGWPVLIDIKTAKAMGNYALEKDLAQWNYHVRLAWYMDALSRVKPADWMTVFVWISNSGPCEVRMSQCDDPVWEEGRAAYRHCLERYARCVESGQWDSYAPGIEVVNPPRWAYRFTTPVDA